MAFLQYWPEYQVFQVDSCILIFFPLSISYDKMFQAHLYPDPGIKLKNANMLFRNQDLGAQGAHATRVSLLLGFCSGWTWKCCLYNIFKHFKFYISTFTSALVSKKPSNAPFLLVVSLLDGPSSDLARRIAPDR